MGTTFPTLSSCNHQAAHTPNEGSAIGHQASLGPTVSTRTPGTTRTPSCWRCAPVRLGGGSWRSPRERGFGPQDWGVAAGLGVWEAPRLSWAVGHFAVAKPGGCRNHAASFGEGSSGSFPAQPGATATSRGCCGVLGAPRRRGRGSPEGHGPVGVGKGPPQHPQTHCFYKPRGLSGVRGDGPRWDSGLAQTVTPACCSPPGAQRIWGMQRRPWRSCAGRPQELPHLGAKCPGTKRAQLGTNPTCSPSLSGQHSEVGGKVNTERTPRHLPPK